MDFLETTGGILLFALVALMITLVILYEIIRTAVKSAIISANKEINLLSRVPMSRQETFTSDQSRLYSKYESGEITFEEYSKEWAKTNQPG